MAAAYDQWKITGKNTGIRWQHINEKQRRKLRILKYYNYKCYDSNYYNNKGAMPV